LDGEVELQTRSLKNGYQTSLGTPIGVPPHSGEPIMVGDITG
jgi:hypothetical protein